MKRHTRFRIQITKTGYLFLALTLGIGIAGLNTGNNLLYLIFSMMLSFVVLSGILSNNALSGLLFIPKFPTRIFAGEKAPVELEIKNQKKWFPSYSLSFSALSKDNTLSSQAYLLKILPGETAKTVDFVSFPRRGKASLPDYEAQTLYPFGLIRKMTHLKTSGETVIYPRRIEVGELNQFSQKWLGDFLSGQAGGASNPFGIRDYVVGDPAKQIHWKSSVRTQSLKVKEFEQEKKQKFHIELVLHNPDQTEEAIREKAVSLATSLLLYFIDRQFEVSLSINGEKVEPQGRGYVDAYLCALALAIPSSKHQAQALSMDNTVLVSDAEISMPGTSIQFGPRELSTL